MPDIVLRIPSTLSHLTNLRRLTEFFQSCLNRLYVGALRYQGHHVGPQPEMRYLSRLKREVAAYERTGNYEHLLNIANYAYLESQAPEHSGFHHDTGAKSATRRTFGGLE